MTLQRTARENLAEAQSIPGVVWALNQHWCLVKVAYIGMIHITINTIIFLLQWRAITRNADSAAIVDPRPKEALVQ